MIICVCLNIKEQEIKELQAQGLSMEEIAKKLNLGSDCGICLEDTFSKNATCATKVKRAKK